MRTTNTAPALYTRVVIKLKRLRRRSFERTQGQEYRGTSRTLRLQQSPFTGAGRLSELRCCGSDRVQVTYCPYLSTSTLSLLRKQLKAGSNHYQAMHVGTVKIEMRDFRLQCSSALSLGRATLRLI